MINNYHHPKTLQEAVDVAQIVKFKSENNNDKRNTKNRIQMEVVNNINRMRRLFNKHINMKKIAIAVVKERIC